MKISSKDADLICVAIDSAVKSTGYPVVGEVLATIGIDRTTIRTLERKGYVKAVAVIVGGGKDSSRKPQYMKGYYANEYPKAIDKESKAE